MSEKIGWSVNVNVEGGPNLSAADSQEVEAYDKIVVVAKAKAGAPGTAEETSVEVQPASDPKDIKFFFVTSNRYDKNLKFDVEEAGGASGIELDKPLLLVGGGIGLLLKSPKKLKFKNDLGNGKDATITILVGRNAK